MPRKRRFKAHEPYIGFKILEVVGKSYPEAKRVLNRRGYREARYLEALEWEGGEDSAQFRGHGQEIWLVINADDNEVIGIS